MRCLDDDGRVDDCAVEYMIRSSAGDHGEEESMALDPEKPGMLDSSSLEHFFHGHAMSAVILQLMCCGEFDVLARG